MKYVVGSFTTSNSGKLNAYIHCEHCRCSACFSLGGYAYQAKLENDIRENYKEAIQEFLDCVNSGKLNIFEKPSTERKIKQILCNCTEGLIDPERKLRALRAKRLVDPSVVIPESLIQIVKNKQPKQVQRLWKELELLGVDVRELVYEGEGFFSFKIYLPSGGYLNCAHRKDIIAFCKKEMSV